MNSPATLRELLAQGPLIAPGAYDALTARIAVLAAARTAQRLYAGLLSQGEPHPAVEQVTFAQYNEIVGLANYRT